MMSNDKALELIRVYGKIVALEIANMIFNEHNQYSEPNYTWRGDFREIYTNAEKCKYWSEVRNFIEQF